MYTTAQYRGQLTLDDIDTLKSKRSQVETAISQNERNFDHDRVWCDKCRDTIRFIDQMIELRNNLNNSQFDIFNK